MALARTCQEPTCGRPSGRSDLCARCRMQEKRTGYRACDFCGVVILLNHIPLRFVRKVQRTVCCIDCRPKRLAAWSWDHDCCAGCQTTSQPYEGHGCCNACRKVEFRKARMCACGQPTKRNYASGGPLVRCRTCYEGGLRKIFDGFCRQASPRSVSASTGIGRAIIAKCYRFLDTGDRTELATLNAAEIAFTVLTACQRQLTNHTTGRPTLAGLVTQLIQGDQNVMDECLRRARPFVCKLLKGRTHPWGTFDDLFQEVMLEVWKALPTWECDGSIWQFLHSVVRNAAGVSYRKASAGKHAILTDQSDSLDEPVGDGDSDQLVHETIGHTETPETIVMARQRPTVNPTHYATAGSVRHALLGDWLQFPGRWSRAARAKRVSKVVKRPITEKAVESAQQHLRRALRTNHHLRSLLEEAVRQK